MPLPIQRVPRGLSDVLSIFGGQTPTQLDDYVRAGIEALQFYGLTQRTVLGLQNAAAAEGAGVALQLPNAWVILFDAQCKIQKTATMTALHAQVGLRYNADPAQEIQVKSDELGPFGATETGFVSACWTPPYPRVMPPNSQVVGRASIIGTDATANVIVEANFGVLG